MAISIQALELLAPIRSHVTGTQALRCFYHPALHPPISPWLQWQFGVHFFPLPGPLQDTVCCQSQVHTVHRTHKWFGNKFNTGGIWWWYTAIWDIKDIDQILQNDIPRLNKYENKHEIKLYVMKHEVIHMAENNPNFTYMIKDSGSVPLPSTLK